MPFDLIVFNKQVYTATTELVDQQVQLFNAASGGAITLSSSTDNQGNFTMRASFKSIAGLVRHRDVYNGQNAVAAVRLNQLQNNSVKTASGTPPIEFEQAQFRWIQQNPAEAALIIGRQLAEGTVQDMLNTAVAGAVAAISGVAALNYTDADSTALRFIDLVSGAGKFGDRQGQILAWIMHSKSMTDLYANAVNNNERLFTYGSVNVTRDPFGRLLIMTDSDSLVVPGTPNTYKVLGLVSGGILVEQNNDFRANLQTANGKENIQDSYQAEGSYNLGLLGYS